MFSFSKESLVELGRRHWKEFQPPKYRELKKAGQLEQALSSAAELTLRAMETDRQAGYRQHEAWEKNRELYLLLPEEEGLPQEQMPHNPAFAALAETNGFLDKLAEEND